MSKYLIIITVLILLSFSGCLNELIVAYPKITSVQVDLHSQAVMETVLLDRPMMSMSSIEGWYRRSNESSSVLHEIRFANADINNEDVKTYNINGYEGDELPGWLPLSPDTYYLFKFTESSWYISNDNTYERTTIEEWSFVNGSLTHLSTKHYP